MTVDLETVREISGFVRRHATDQREAAAVRNRTIREAYRTGRYSLSQLGEASGLSKAQVGRITQG
jgi:hypothetical protein